MSTTSLDMLRARHAMARVDEVARLQSDGGAEKYGSYVKALPATVIQIGLGQAMATLLSKAGSQNAYGLLYSHLEDWLCRGTEHSPYHAPDGSPNLMRAITEGEQSSYIYAQAEAMAYLNWLKKFAAAYLAEDT